MYYNKTHDINKKEKNNNITKTITDINNVSSEDNFEQPHHVIDDDESKEYDFNNDNFDYDPDDNDDNTNDKDFD